VENDAVPKWLSIVGIGEDEFPGLTPVARSLIAQANVLVGGERHLSMLPANEAQETLTWTSPIEASIEAIVQRRRQAVCVLASGDPMCYGIGVTLTRRLAVAEMTILPAPSAFSLVCARLGWSLTDVEMVSLCGRHPALLHAVLYPEARILVLSAGKHTPAEIATQLTQRGFGDSELVVFERMGGAHGRMIRGKTSTWQAAPEAALNTIAITCVADPGVTGWSRCAG
jgi:precorrin-6Y C5,15-methyltransferase (decarboxylating)